MLSTKPPFLGWELILQVLDREKNAGGVFLVRFQQLKHPALQVLLSSNMGFTYTAMAASSSFSSPLGVSQILRRSVLLPFKSGQLLSPLLLLSLLSSSLQFFCVYSLAPIPLDLASKICILVKETKRRPDNLLADIEKDLKTFAALGPAFAVFFFVFALFLTLAAMYTFAMAYTNANLTPQNLLLRIRRRWYQTMVTRLYILLLTLGLGLVSSLAVGSVMLVADGSQSVFGFGVSLAFVASFFYLYLLTRWSMSLVIAAVEETWGIGALSWSVELYIGNKKRGVSLTLMLMAVQAAIYAAFAAVVTASGPQWPAGPMALGSVVATADAVWNLYSMAVYTVFYYECRKSHGLEDAGLSAALVTISAGY